jgi:predicted O-methyltransferase YrrM
MMNRKISHVLAGEESAYADKKNLYWSARKLVPELRGITFDLAFIDGRQEAVSEYYEINLAHLRERRMDISPR